ncbi:MAG: type II secretion system F family protein [Campylobacterota bacterium]|nr:type II secretion system F family protein [Campylobacterota bacterium]
MVDVLTFFKTLLFSLQNGKSVSQALESLRLSSTSKKEKKVYLKIESEIKDGKKLSDALLHVKLFSYETIEFVTLAEKSTVFHQALAQIVDFLEVKERFLKESSDKITLPFVYFSLAAIIVISLQFFVIPFQIEQTTQYDDKIRALISEHLSTAVLLTNILFVMLVLIGSYFFIFISAISTSSKMAQSITKNIAVHLPFVSTIVMKFEKFVLLSMLGHLLQSGISFKISLEGAYYSTTIRVYKKIFINILKELKVGKKSFYKNALFNHLEQQILSSVGATKKLGSTFVDISDNARQDALLLSGKFFRLMIVSAIFLMAFAVFIEFFTVVLTQILIQKGMINAVDAVRSGF